ncbi:MAG: KH domain-containing protein [Candidatus Micrarchaeia archaeon]
MAKIVVPGVEVAQKPLRMAYTYTDGEGTFATVISLLSEEGKLIPLEGPYEPLQDDYVIGFVAEVRFGGYDIDIASPYRAFLSSREMRTKLSLGEIVMVRINKIDEVRSMELGDVRSLKDGILHKISPVKVPRLIGKKNSMINMIAQASGCRMLVGRNGLVFISSDGNYNLAVQAISMIEALAHTQGLTDRVSHFLSEKTGKSIVPPSADSNMNQAQTNGEGQGQQEQYGQREYSNSRPQYRRHNNYQR